MRDGNNLGCEKSNISFTFMFISQCPSIIILFRNPKNKFIERPRSVCLSIYLPTYLPIHPSIYLSMALQPFVGPSLLFSFLIFLHSR
jgi:hypothetical protein